MSLEKYRETMAEDVLHSWASDAQNKITELTVVVSELRDAFCSAYSASPEGRDYLSKIDEVLKL